MIESIDLGLVKAIHKGLTAPTNTDMLWYDDNLGVKKHKYYDTVLSAWTALAPPSGVTGSGTLGYLPKWSATSVIEDSSIYQTGSGSIGVGTINPLTNFHVSGTNASSIILSTRYSSDNASSGFIAAKARGTEAAPSGILLGDKMLNVSAYGYTSAGAFSTEVGKMVFYATEDFTGSANGTAFKISTTPIGATVDVFNFGINENGYVSIGDTNLAPTARLHVTGVSATSSDYALKVDNLVGSPLLYVRNDNAVSIGTTPVVDSRLQINNSVFGKASISLGGADYYGIDVNTTGLSMLLGVNTSNNKQLWLADQDKLASNGTNPVLQFGLFGVSPSAINALSTNGSYLDLVLQSNGGNVGISTGVINPTARLHVKGNSAPGDFIFKAEGAGGNLSLYVRNDGFIQAGTFANSYFYFDPSLTLPSYEVKVTDGLTTSQFLLDKDTVNINNAHGQIVMALGDLQLTATSRIFLNAALINAVLIPADESLVASGDLYVDTAANILANGDLIVARKV